MPYHSITPGCVNSASACLCVQRRTARYQNLGRRADIPSSGPRYSKSAGQLAWHESLHSGEAIVLYLKGDTFSVVEEDAYLRYV